MTETIDAPRTDAASRSRRFAEVLRENKARASVLAGLVFFFVAAIAGLEADQWFPTIMQGLSFAALVFLVASGFQLIFGLMDVLNLAHGEFFMLGAYMGWTVYTRFDTFIDLLVPALVVIAPFALLPLWSRLGARVASSERWGTVAKWGLPLGGLAMVGVSITRFPLAIWNPDEFSQAPVNMSVQVDLGTLAPLPADSFGWPMALAVAVLFLGGALLALGLSAVRTQAGPAHQLTSRHVGIAAGLVVAAVVLHLVRGPLNEWVFALSTTWRFVMAIVVSSLIGAALGAVVEIVLIRPLYTRPIYTLMVTLGVGFVLIELAREVWGQPEFTMARPAAFNGTGEGCPAEGIGGFFSGCSTLVLFGSRLRVYNEGFIILMGVLVLVGVTLLLKRTRIGMTIRAGVQDPEMVEALGINVRSVFTQVFALASGLAALGGVLAAPSIGLSTQMGALFLLTAIVALAIGGLSSFPGAAAGALLIGLIQQVIIRLGQTGISLPFLDEPFRPSPTLVPAASIILMVVILLVLPSGLFGREAK